MASLVPSTHDQSEATVIAREIACRGPPSRPLTARRDPERTAGVLVCTDLACRDRLEYFAERNGVDARPKVEALLQRMSRFADSLYGDPTKS